MTTFKQGDIYRWSWKEEQYRSYWCCSQIGIVNDQLKLAYTYWGDNSKTFTKEYCDENMDLEFIANIDNLEKQPEYHQTYYKDKDCVNLNHANSRKGNFYIRKGAKRCLDKMKKIMNRNLVVLDHQKHQIIRQIKLVEAQLENLSLDFHMNIEAGVSLSDHDFLDEYNERNNL